MKFAEARLKGVWLIDLLPRYDERGYFMRTVCLDTLAMHSLNTNWVQSNLSFSAKKGTLRGMHFQKEPSSEIKLIQCITGAIYDVVVDIRRGSPTFGEWVTFELNEKRPQALYVPEGFAHGFQCLTDNCRVSYQMSVPYVSQLSGGVRWNDPEIGIKWPLEHGEISERDAALPLLHELP